MAIKITTNTIQQSETLTRLEKMIEGLKKYRTDF